LTFKKSTLLASRLCSHNYKDIGVLYLIFGSFSVILEKTISSLSSLEYSKLQGNTFITFFFKKILGLSFLMILFISILNIILPVLDVSFCESIAQGEAPQEGTSAVCGVLMFVSITSVAFILINPTLSTPLFLLIGSYFGGGGDKPGSGPGPAPEIGPISDSKPTSLPEVLSSNPELPKIDSVNTLPEVLPLNPELPKIDSIESLLPKVDSVNSLPEVLSSNPEVLKIDSICQPVGESILPKVDSVISTTDVLPQMEKIISTMDSGIQTDPLPISGVSPALDQQISQLIEGELKVNEAFQSVLSEAKGVIPEVEQYSVEIIQEFFSNIITRSEDNAKSLGDMLKYLKSFFDNTSIIESGTVKEVSKNAIEPVISETITTIIPEPTIAQEMTNLLADPVVMDVALKAGEVASNVSGQV